MDKMNCLLMTDPYAFLKEVLVDNITMQRKGDGAANLTALNDNKRGVFDLRKVEDGQVELAYGGVKNYALKNDSWIEAYWCPFLNGKDMPGWVDVPRANPFHTLVFTAAMQGCAFVLTDSPESKDRFRVFHNQHPEYASTWKAMYKEFPNLKIISIFSYKAAEVNADYRQYATQDGYGSPDKKIATNAFNLLVWDKNTKTWKYLSQSHILTPSGGMDFTVKRDPAKPILELATGV